MEAGGRASRSPIIHFFRWRWPCDLAQLGSAPQKQPPRLSVEHATLTGANWPPDCASPGPLSAGIKRNLAADRNAARPSSPPGRSPCRGGWVVHVFSPRAHALPLRFGLSVSGGLQLALFYPLLLPVLPTCPPLRLSHQLQRNPTNVSSANPADSELPPRRRTHLNCSLPCRPANPLSRAGAWPRRVLAARRTGCVYIANSKKKA